MKLIMEILWKMPINNKKEILVHIQIRRDIDGV